MRTAPVPNSEVVIEAIYDAAAGGDWHAALSRVAGLADSQSGVMQMGDTASGVTDVFATHNGSNEAVEAYRVHFFGCDLFLHRAPPLGPAGKLVLSQDCMADAELSESEFFRDFLRPMHNGAFYNAAFILPMGRTQLLMVSVQRGHRRGGFGPGHVSQLSRLWPHLRRAAGIRQRMIAAEARTANALDALDTLATGVLLLEADRRLEWANRAALRLIAGSGGAVALRGHRLVLHRAEDDARLARAVACAAGGSPEVERAMPVRRPDNTVLALVVAPFHPGERRRAGLPPRAVVLLADPAAARPGLADRAAAVFGLTPAEARLAEVLANGASPEEAAERGGTRISTVRSQIRSLFAKTGATRHSTLLRSLLSLPAPDSPPD